MKIMFKLTLKDLLKHKKSFILCLISVLLSCILLFSIGLAVSTTRQNQINNIINLYGDQHAIYYTTTNNKNILNDERISKYYYIFKIKDNLYGISDNFDIDLNLEGKLPTNNNEIIVSFKTANQLNLKIGSIYQDKKIVGIYQNDYFKKFNLENISLTKDAENNNDALYFVYLKKYKNIYNELRSIVNNLEDYDISINNSLLYYYAGADPIDNFSSNSNEVFLLMTMFLCLILAFVVFFIIYNAFSISVNEKKKSYAMYKSIGASPKQILFSVFLDSFIILLIAIPLGFILSTGFVSLVLLIINNILQELITNNYTLEIYPLFILVSLIFILISTFLATLSPAQMASRINIIEEVRQTKKFKHRKENKLVKKIFGIEGLISANSVTRDRAKYRVTTISIVVGIVLFLTVTCLLSIALFNNYDYDNYDYAYIGLYDNTTNIKSVINYISNLDTVTDYVYFNKDYFRFETETKVNNLKENVLNFYYLDEISYNKLKEYYKINNDDPIIINTLKNKKKVFDLDKVTLTLTPYSSYEEQIKTTINANVVRTLGPLEKYNNIFESEIFLTIFSKYNDEDESTIYIKSNDYLKLDKQLRLIVSNNKDTSYFNYPAINYENIVKSNCYRLVIYIALLFIIFITFASIIGTISANINLRRREFAILKSIGLSNKSFNKMIFYESLMLSLKSLLFGLLIFILIVVIFLRISMISENTFKSLLQIPFDIFIIPLISCILGVIIINYLSFLIATSKIKKDNIIDVIKTN